MSNAREVVITGMGIVCPLGIGRQAVWDALCAGRSGVSRISTFDSHLLPVQLAAEVRDFDPKQYVRPRKSLKVMARDTQFGVTVAELACLEAGLTPGKIDPDRVGVVFGADTIASEMTQEAVSCYSHCVVDGQFQMERWGPHGMPQAFPLEFLKILPNMIASHIAIAQDARGPNNTLHENEVSSLMAVAEARRVIERGWADCMIAGGSSSRMQPIDWVRGCLTENLTRFEGDPAAASSPFDAQRSGQVKGEGAAAFILESRSHAQRRGARILATLAGTGSSFEVHRNGTLQCGCGLQRAMQQALSDAGLKPGDLGHINAHGLSTRVEDRWEAQALHQLLPDVPVTAPKSFFGNLGAAGGAVEMAVSLMAVEQGLVPVTLNYRHPDPECPVQVIHDQPLVEARRTALAVNFTMAGQTTAVILRCDE